MIYYKVFLALNMEIITNSKIYTKYNESHDTWLITDNNKLFRAEINYEGALILTNAINKIIQQIQPELNTLIEIVINYHKEREQTWYFDFRNKANGIISNEFIDKPELKIIILWEYFIELISGSKEPQTMFMNNELKMSGSLMKALKIQSVINNIVNNLKSKL